MAQVYYPFDPGLVSEWAGTDRGGGVRHYGTDFAVFAGTPVPATADMQIVFIGDDGLGGFTIDGIEDNGIRHRFGHLSWNTARVTLWQRVSAGTILALSGNSGFSFGDHLHWELRRDNLWTGGAWIDPRTLNPAMLGSGAQKPGVTALKRKDQDMHAVFLNPARSDGSPAYAVYRPGVKGSWEEFDNSSAKGAYANAIASQVGTPMGVSLKKWLELQAKYSAKKL